MKSTSVGLDLPSDRWSRWTRRLIASIALAATAAGAFAQSYTISTLAGNGIPGSTDSSGGTPTFTTPAGVTVDSLGNVYVADSNNSRIRKITGGGVVSTLASSGFSGANAVAVDGGGNVYVADTNNHVIKKVDGGGNVTVIAGLSGASGDSVAGPVSTGVARFRNPAGIAVNGAGTLVYVADTNNHVIRSINIGTGLVTTIAGIQGSAGTGATQFSSPAGLALTGTLLYVADKGNHAIRRIDLNASNALTTFAGTAGTSGTTDTPALFNQPTAVAVDGSGNLFVTDYTSHTIRRITSGGSVSTIAGSPGSATFVDGVGAAARFSGPWGIAVDGSGNFYVGDSNNQRIRKGVLGAVSTAPTFNAHPSNATFTIGTFTSAIFTVSSPNGTTYQWQRAPASAPASFTNLSNGSTDGITASNVNTTTLTISGALITNNGDQFRVVVGNGTLPDATSNAAILTVTTTVSTAPTINTQPQSLALTSGATSAFFNVFATATPGITSYQWERNINGTSTFTPIVDGTFGGITFTGATSQNLSISGVTPLMNGDQYRVVVSNGTPTTSNFAVLNVPPAFATVGSANFAVSQFSNFQIVAAGIPAPTISISSGLPPSGINFNPGGSTNTTGTATLSGSSGTLGSTFITLSASNSGGVATQSFNINVVQPQAPIITSEASTTFVVNQPGSFTFQGFGAPSPTFSLNGPLPAGLQFISPVLSGTPLNADNSPISFTVVASNSSGSSTPQTFTLTILGVPPTITLQPISTTANIGGSASFTAGAAGTPAPQVRWQRQPSGTSGFVDLADSVNFAGTRATTLTINNVEPFMSGDQFRMVATNNNNLSVNTISATLTVNVGTTFTTFAGMAQFPGANDGTGNVARFNSPFGVATDSGGNVYIADTVNHTIRRVTSGGVVTTIAGQAGAAGSNDGLGTGARFNSPQGVSVDVSGNVYVADTGNHTIRVISSVGNVSTLAGLAGVSGTVDDIGGSARFNRPVGIVVDNSGTVFVADSSNHAIRRVFSNGSVTTFAGSMGSPGFFDNFGQLARFNTPIGLARDTSGNLYVADSFNHTIRKINSGGNVTTIGGTGGNPGVADGNLQTARFNRPYGVAVDFVGNVYVADTFSHTLRRISPSSDTTTIAGVAGVAGSNDGGGGQARFNQPSGIALDGAGNIYVADTGNHAIRRSGAALPAQITTQPTNRTAGVGANATFTVTATGAPNPGYQWQRQAANSFGFTSLANNATYSGVNTASLTISGVTQVMSGDQFRVIVNNGVPPVVESSTATLTVGIAPVFTSPATASFQAQQAGTFNVAVTSTPAATFTATGLPSWATLNSTTGQITGTPPDTSGSPFAVTITANNGIAATQALSLVVTAAPPTITTHPVSATVDQGQTASFSVAVGGTAPFTYQWRRNGGAIGGATGATLQLPNVQPSAQGVYSVSVSNAVGNVVSNGATLSVNSLPAIISQPGPQVALAGGSATFSVVATGGSINYQWRKNGAPVAGANGSTLTLSNVAAADAGNFDVQVSNGFGLVNSSLAQLTIVATPTVPVITAQPAARTVLVGGTTTLSIGATGAPAPGYQWRKNGSPISGANGQTYVLTNVQAGDAANYDVVVTNSVGSVTSSPAGVTVISRSFVGYYFGSFSNSLGDFSIYVREDNTGVFLGYLPGSNSPIMTLSLRVNDAGQFSFSQGSIAIGGTLNSNGTLSGSILGSVNGTFGGDRAAENGGSQGVAGFYQAGANNGAGTAYVIAGPNNVAFAVVQTSAASDGGRGAVANTGGLTVSTNRSVITGTITTSGILSGSSSGGVTMNFSGGSDAMVALQRLVNISSRARVAAGDAVAIAGFVISGEVSKPVLIRAVGPTLAAAPFNVPGALTTPRVELFSGTTSLVVNSGIAANRAAIDAAGQQAGAFPLGAAGTDAAILTTLAPGNYTAVVSSSTAAAGVVLVEVYDLSGAAAGQKLLNIATRAAAGVNENTLIAGFVVPPGTSKRVLIRGVGPGLTVFGVTGVLAQPVLSLLSGGTTIAQNTNWTTSADAAVITSASVQAGAFGLSNNDSAMVVTLAPGNYTAQVVGVNGGTGVALIEVYELP